MKKLSKATVQKYSKYFSPDETYWNLDGFIFLQVKPSIVTGLMAMNKEVYELFDDDTESLVQPGDTIRENSVYGISMDFLEQYEKLHLLDTINKNLGIK
jgi:hypothetical protein